MRSLLSWLGVLPRRSSVAKVRAEADRARDARDWRQAAELYESVLAQDRRDAAIRIQAGHMRKEAGDLAAAELHYLAAMTIVPDDADLSLQLGHFYKVAGRDLEAYAAYRRAVKLDPESEDARREYAEMGGRARAQLGVREEEVVVERGVARQPSAANAQVADALTIALVQESGLFDAAWYLKNYPDVAATGADPLAHFTDHGRKEGRRPGPRFEGDWYAETYPEAHRSGLDPFAHYLLVGRDQGFRPAGPPMYERWVAQFDTLGDEDIRRIGAHIADARLVRPDVVVHVDAATAPFVGDAIRGLRGQILKPRLVELCLAADCPESVARSLVAAVGSDEMFRVVDADAAGARRVRPGQAAAPFEDGALVLIDAGVQLREHALYLAAEARARGATLAYADEDRLGEREARHSPFFKPDASPELIRQTPYAGAFALLPQDATADGLIADLSRGAGVLELIRAAFLAQERTSIAHIPHVLFHDRAADVRGAPIPIGGPAPIATEALPTVTIIVPTRDRVDLLGVCLESIVAHTDYPREKMDIVVVDNGSTDPDTLAYFEQGAGEGRFRVLRDPQPFNFARLNNIAAATSVADIVLLLNNDTEVQDSTWLRGLVRYAMLPDAGAVGPKLLYDDGTIQHAGVVLGIGVAAAHAHCGIEAGAPGDYGFAQRTREVSAVTGACLAIRRAVLDEIGGLDEQLKVAFNDVSLCLAAIEHGYRNIYVHDVWLRHFESKSRGVDDTPAKVDIFIGEANYARRKHSALFAADPFYNPNLSVMLETFYEPAFPPRCPYPWRDHARADRKPRVLFLAGVTDSSSEILVTLSYQARYLADAGCEVTIGTGTRMAGLFEDRRIRGAVLKDMAAAANFAVVNDIDCIVAHTAIYAGVSRLLGARPRVILYHHGFAIEAAGAANVGREAHVAIRLALPAAAAVLAASPETIAELEDDARDEGGTVLLPPGGDRLGGWTLSMATARDEIRRTRGWGTRSIMLFEAIAEPLRKHESARLAGLASQIDGDTVTLVMLPAANGYLPSVPGFETISYNAVSRAGLLAAADVLVQTEGASPLLAAEAAAFGLPIVAMNDKSHDKAGDPAFAALRIAEAVVAGQTIWSRRTGGRTWADQVEAFRAIAAAKGGFESKPATAAPRMILSAAALVEASGLFDARAYLKFNPDVAEAKADPWHHFVNDGGPEGRRASWLFDTKWYQARYPEVARAKLSPMAHYLSQPRGDYDPNPYFDNAHYLETYPDVATSGLSPLIHYLRIGAGEGRDIGSRFDAGFYERAHSDVAPSGMGAFVHFLTIGDAEGRVPVKPALSPIDLFDNAALEGAMRRPIGEIAPRETLAGEITDRRSAARFCVTLLRKRPDLRHRFPDALSAGAGGGFAAWLAGEGGAKLGVTDRGRFFLDRLFETDFAERVRQVYLVRTDLRRLLPFALLPEGAGDFLEWGLDAGVAKEGFAREEIWWLLLLSAERPAAALATTYLFTPSWQVNVPDGLTVFGDGAFIAWLRETYGLSPVWTENSHADALTPATELRVAYHARSAWQAEHPRAFDSAATAGALIDWLVSPAAALSDRARGWLAVQDRAALAAELATPGVNMIGHFCYPSGLRTSTEALVKGCRDVGLRVTERDNWVQLPGDDDRHADFRGLELYDTTIILSQPEPYFDVAYARAGLAPRDPRTYRIAYWYWEQDKIPDQWQVQADQVDEIWTSTHFVGDALKAQFDKPIKVIPHGMELPPFGRLPRSHFGLPEDQFLFLFTFHMMSIMERKNPLGLIEAFSREFRADEKVGLVLKTSFGNHHPKQIEELRKAAAGHNITIIDAVYTKAEVLALMDACDSYVSLHRSEGFGLTMVEAMLCGKPTIATGYSGNLDFMTPGNSLLVDYELLTLDKDYPPYKAGSHWAKASIRHAGQCMRKVQSDPEWARQLGLRARADLERTMSHEASGRMVAARLREIDEIRKGVRLASGSR